MPEAADLNSTDLTGIVTQPDPRAAQEQIVVQGNVRFSVLTNRLIRLEYAHDGAFEDRASLAVVNRRFPTTKIQATTKGNSLTVDTGAVTVRCSDVTRPFTRNTLTAETKRGDTKWSYGVADRKNLGGTVRTLDGWDGNKVARFLRWDDETGVVNAWDEQDLGKGLCTRGDWTVFDDSGTVVLDPLTGGRAAKGRPWPTEREPGKRQDLYLFAYGTDHVGALRDASRLFGPQPLPPRFAFGYWYSRYYPYTAEELIAVAAELDQHRVPADVLVIDMDWHKLGWTGYSWDTDLFPDPTATLATIHDHGLRTCLNLHPADGVGSHEDAFPEMCAAMGLDPDTTDKVPFDLTDPRFVDAYLRLLHHPQEDRGVDFWWMDWQQGTETVMPGLDPLAWLNHLHWEDAAKRRPSRRPLSFSRWDGIGAGRHPVGFSGDTYATWESLAFQPHMTATAANVLYGYWSHDIGGHFGGRPDPELYTRWLQFGAYSPVLRTHGTLDPLIERKVWEFPNPYRQVMIDSIRRRYELVPYIYSECRRGLDCGRSLVAPMYHEFPEVEQAYKAPGQYMFGSDMIIAPVVTPIGSDSMGGVRVWLPEGEWHDAALGQIVTVTNPAGEWSERRYLLGEVPVFVRSGAIIPGQQDVNRLRDASYPNLSFTVHPGANGRCVVYEDDGVTQGYLEGRSVELTVEHRCSSTRRQVRVLPATGAYRGWQRKRDLEVRFELETPPRSVRVDDVEIFRDAESGRGHWSFDAEKAAVVIHLGSVDLRSETVITVERTRKPRPTGESTSNKHLFDGLPGMLRRLKRIDTSTRTLLGEDNRRITAVFRAFESIPDHPDRAAETVQLVRETVPEIAEILARHAQNYRSLESLNPLDPPTNSTILDSIQALAVATQKQFG